MQSTAPPGANKDDTITFAISTSAAVVVIIGVSVTCFILSSYIRTTKINRRYEGML